MARLRFPADVPKGSALFQLLEELYKLHARAGRPGARQLEKQGHYSHTSVHQMFTKNRVPKYPLLMGVLSTLMPMVPGIQEPAVRRRFIDLWTAADDEETAQHAMRIQAEMDDAAAAEAVKQAEQPVSMGKPLPLPMVIASNVHIVEHNDDGSVTYTPFVPSAPEQNAESFKLPPFPNPAPGDDSRYLPIIKRLHQLIEGNRETLSELAERYVRERDLVEADGVEWMKDVVLMLSDPGSPPSPDLVDEILDVTGAQEEDDREIRELATDLQIEEAE